MVSSFEDAYILSSLLKTSFLSVSCWLGNFVKIPAIISKQNLIMQ